MATYGTDLVVIATGSDGSGGTWTEFTDWDSGGTPASETENYIQGAASYSQTFGNATTGKSICFDAGSDVSSSIPTGDVIMAWVFMGAATNMYGYASGGHRFGIGASVGAFDMWYISGDDRPPNPYGGWWNVAIDPRHSVDAIDEDTTGSGGAWRFFGSLIGATTLGIRNKVAKGSPHAVDGMLMGRGEIYCTGTGATFTLMAGQNDLVANRWGLLQDTGGGTFLWKGLMSLGQVGTSTTFSDSNKTIVIDDCPKTYPGFNKIEINNASSSITLTNVSFTAKGTYAPGNFEMIANATLSFDGCSFNNMGTFIFDSNAEVLSSSFNGCGQITTGAADITGCAVNASTNTSAVLCATPAEAALISGSTFVSAGTGHAIEIGGTAANITLTDNVFTGYDTADPGTSTNKAIYVNIATGSMTITVSGGSGLSQTAVRTAGATVTVNSDTTVTFTGMKDNTEVRIFKVSDDSVVDGIEDATAGTADNRTFAWSAPAGTVVYYRLHNWQPGVPVYESIEVSSYTVPSNDTSILVSQRIDRNAV